MSTYINVYAEATPNPESLKFVVNLQLVEEGGGSYEFRNEEEALDSPLASELFATGYIKNVFIAADFVAITKTSDKKWIELLPQTRTLIKTFFEAGKPALNPDYIKRMLAEDVKKASQQTANNEQISTTPEEAIIFKIKEILDQSIKPAVEQDGGAIDFKSFEEGVVTVSLRGSCSGCPSSTITLKSGIENLLKNMIPEVKEVIAEGV